MSAEAAMEQQPGCTDGRQMHASKSAVFQTALRCASVRTEQEGIVGGEQAESSIAAAPGLGHPRIMRSEDWACMSNIEKACDCARRGRARTL